MDKQLFYSMMSGSGNSDYELYLETKKLLSCQKDPADLCNVDEMQFQLVHQAEELMFKLIGFTLLEIDDYLAKRETSRVVGLFRRVHKAQNLMLDLFPLLETMSPKDYQAIRLKLGSGSGTTSPGFRSVSQMPKYLWQRYKVNYLDNQGLDIEKIYNSKYTYSEAYLIAELLFEFDALYYQFLHRHMLLIQRTIGWNAKSLKGNPVELLNRTMNNRFFPELWEIRGRMTDEWGKEYGYRRDPLNQAE